MELTVLILILYAIVWHTVITLVASDPEADTFFGLIFGFIVFSIVPTAVLAIVYWKEPLLHLVVG